MKITTTFDLRIAAIAGLLLTGLGLSYVLPASEKSSVVQSSYPAQACPFVSAAGTTTAYLPAAKLRLRSIDGTTTKFHGTSFSSVSLGSSAIIVDSNPGTSLSYSQLASSGIALVPCSAGKPDEWFIGGSGGVTSKGVLDLVNSGLSGSIVDIFAYTSKGALPLRSVTVKANSSASISLDSLAPGDDSIALHVVTRTGRVSAFLLDIRSKGLRKLGIDYVKQSEAPNTRLFISGLYPNTGSKSSVVNSLRILNPGTLDATMKVHVLSSDGSFIPVGFDELTVKPGLAKTLPLENLRTSSAFGLAIESDHPILAGVLTSNGSADFGWAAPSPALDTVTMNFGGNTPLVTFIGNAISVKVSGRFVTGKRFNQTVSGADIAFWAPKVGVQTVNFRASGSGIYAGALVKGGGLTYIPIANGATIENTALPFNDVHTLTH